MSTWETLKAEFEANWTTVLVGWNGLGPFSPWPDCADEIPPLLSCEEIVVYATERLELVSAVVEQNLIAKLLSLDLHAESRQTTRKLLARLSGAHGGDEAVELRKWRLILLEELLSAMPQDALYGLLALSEFWQGFGFPPDGPHEVQGRENGASPNEYYQDCTVEKLP